MKNTVFSVALFAMLLVCVAVQYRLGYPGQAYLFNSDGLYLPVLFADLFQHGGHLRDWYLTPAPYFFPDFLLYAVAYVSSQGAFEQLLVYGLLQLCVMTVAMRWVVRACVREHATTVAVLSATAIVWMATTMTGPYQFALTSAYHFGAFVAALVFVALWLHRESAPARAWWQLVLMCVVAFLGTLSDTLFLVQTVIPFVATSILARTKDAPRSWKPLVPGAFVLASALAGMTAYRLVVSHNTRYPTRLGLQNVALNFHELIGLIGAQGQQVPILGILLCVYLALAVAGLTKLAIRQPFLHLPRAGLLLLVFSLMAVGSNLLAMLLITNLGVTARYLIPAMCWPLIVMAVLLASWSARRFTMIGVAGAVLLVGQSCLHTYRAIPSAPGDSPAYPADIACVDHVLAAYNVKHGIAEYWDAKRIQSFSRQPVTIAQYFPDMTEHRWITSQGYYRAAYDFAIVRNEAGYQLPQEKIMMQNGPPLATVICAARTILIYKSNTLRVS